MISFKIFYENSQSVRTGWINMDYRTWTPVHRTHGDVLDKLNPPATDTIDAIAAGHVRVRSRGDRIVIETTTLQRLRRAVRFLDDMFQLDNYRVVHGDIALPVDGAIVTSYDIDPITHKITRKRFN